MLHPILSNLLRDLLRISAGCKRLGPNSSLLFRKACLLLNGEFDLNQTYVVELPILNLLGSRFPYNQVSVDLPARLTSEIAHALTTKAHPNLVIGLASQNARSILILYEKNDFPHTIFKFFFGCAKNLF